MSRCIVIIIAFLTSCTIRKQQVIAFDADSLARNIAVLSADSFEGRKPFTRGEKRTVGFIEDQFRRAGLEPGNGNSYLQQVPMVSITANAGPAMTVKSNRQHFSLTAPDEYIIWTNKTGGNISLENTSVVFAGYGVVAPEYGWDDYKGIDVQGKLVIVMVNDPGFWSGDTTLFKGRTMTYYGRWTYKFEEAARHGAKGCLVVHRTAAAGYGFRVLQNDFNTSRLQLADTTNSPTPCDVIGWITDTAAAKLLTAAGYDDQLFKKADKPGFRAIPLNLSVSASMTERTVYNSSPNVLGKITGSKHPEEVVVYTAHWDHLGIGPPDESGDSIYNGARDNASGVAGLIELARAFRKLTVRPDRTILFIASTGEEQGLLGSEYYVRHPVFPIAKTVAAINIDVLNNWGITKDIVVVGLGQSDLDDYVKAIVEKEGGYVTPESNPGSGGFFRSDHFNFAKAGIPALYAGSGDDLEGKGKIYGRLLKDSAVSRYYHRPSDEYDPRTWNIRASLRDLHILFEVGRRTAFTKDWPQWKKTSEFRSIRQATK